VGDAGLEGDLATRGAEERVEVATLRIADRAERVTAAAHGRRVLATLLEQVLAQGGGLELTLVAAQNSIAAEEARDLGPDPARLDQPPRMSHVARGPVQRSFQAAHHIVARVDVHGARILHLPVNLAGTGWAHVNALRRKDIDARLLAFWPHKSRPHQPPTNPNLPLP